MTESLLSPYRVLDLTDETGHYAGKLLGDLGADVIKVERPEGDPARDIGPFFKDIPHPEKSLSWATNNTSKRGITLDIETADGQQIFKKLVQRSDFVIESFAPGYMDGLGLGYKDLKKLNPRIIVTSITPFGQSGPYSHHKATDLTSMAMGGLMFITGDADRPPIRTTIPQAGLLGSAHATTGTMIAHYYRELTGEGQHVDVSIQEAVARILFMEPMFWDFDHYLVQRYGPQIHRGKIFQTETWPCKDGQVTWRLFTGVFGKRTQSLVDWMNEEGMAGALKEVKDWEQVNFSKVTQEQSDAWETAIGEFFKKHTMKELQKEAQKRFIFLAPCYTPKEIAEDEQIASRDYWVQVEHPEWGASVTYPGAPVKMNLTPWKIYRRAPLIGEHNVEVYKGELGLSDSDLVMLKQAKII
ncbi:MAG: CoA transferase [Chloroflexi bacterium]|nr:CoA transferase [Chloroflexota bacterium]